MLWREKSLKDQLEGKQKDLPLLDYLSEESDGCAEPYLGQDCLDVLTSGLHFRMQKADL